MWLENMFVITLFILHVFVLNSAMDITKKTERILITCHSTDYECFKRQYKSLRDNVLLGNRQLDIPVYKPYIFKYGNTGTCVKFSGVEESELRAISMDNQNKQFSLVLEMPIRIQQIASNRTSTVSCVFPDKEFEPLEPHTGALKKFSGNATVQVTYPYIIRKKKREYHMYLQEQNLDVVLDVPDLSQYDKESELETKLFEWSEWAYDMVQHVDVAQHLLLPYTNRLRDIMEKLPFNKFLTLYPNEQYTDVSFSYSDVRRG